MRLFVALDLEEQIRRRISLYVQGLSGFAPEARWAAAASLHVTLKFIGEQPEEQMPHLQEALAAIQTRPISLALRGSGFFPTASKPRVFWLGIKAAQDLPDLAAHVDKALTALAIPREEHSFAPHLTLARVGSGAPHLPREKKSTSRFARLQKQLTAMPEPDFGTMTASEFYLYRSQLSPKGSRYTKLASFPLRG